MPSTRAQQIAHIVRNARLARGWTQPNLAEEVGVHRQTIGNLERASHQTHPELLEKLEEVLDVDLSPQGVAGQAAIDMIVLSLTDKMRDLGPHEGLRLGSDVLDFVEEWEPKAKGTRRRSG